MNFVDAQDPALADELMTIVLDAPTDEDLQQVVFTEVADGQADEGQSGEVTPPTRGDSNCALTNQTGGVGAKRAAKGGASGGGKGKGKGKAPAKNKGKRKSGR